MKFENSTNMNQKKYSKKQTSKNIVKILVKIPPYFDSIFYNKSKKRTNSVSTYYVATIYQKNRGKLLFDWD